MKCEIEKDAPLTFVERIAGILGCLSPVVGMVLVGLVCGGCFNIVGHAASEKPYNPYEATRGISCGIAEAFVEKPEWHGGSHGEAAMSHAYAVLFLPVFVVGLPLEAVADTLTLPYDLYRSK